MARILITGGAGYVGSHYVKALAAAGYECVVFDNLSTGHEFVRCGQFVGGDIRDARTLRQYSMPAHPTDAVMHFAALAYVGKSVGASVYEVVETARAVTGLDIDARPAPRRAGDPSALVADAGSARQCSIGPPIIRILATSITDAWRWYRQRFRVVEKETRPARRDLTK